MLSGPRQHTLVSSLLCRYNTYIHGIRIHTYTLVHHMSWTWSQLLTVYGATAGGFPNATISTLASHGSREPPQILQFRDNVMIRVCLDTVDQSAPLSHPRNAAWQARLRAWRAASPRVWTWDYLTNGQYNLAPWPVVQNIGPNLEFLASVGIQGHYADMTADRGMDMSALKLYVLGRKGLDLSQNVTSLVRFFTDEFFGQAAAVHVRRYIDVLGASMLQSGKALPPSTDPGGEGDENRGWQSSPVFANGTFLTAAAAMAGGWRAATLSGMAEQIDRMEEAFIPCQFIALVRWRQLRDFANRSQQVWPFSPTIQEEFDKFAATVRRLGIPYISQGLHTKGRCGYHCTIEQFRAQVIPKEF
jgi:hypothetical protein